MFPVLKLELWGYEPISIRRSNALYSVSSELGSTICNTTTRMCADYKSCLPQSPVRLRQGLRPVYSEKPLQGWCHSDRLCAGRDMDVIVGVWHVAKQAGEPDPRAMLLDSSSHARLVGLHAPGRRSRSLEQGPKSAVTPAGHFLITQNVPFRQPAHYGRAECINHPPIPD